MNPRSTLPVLAVALLLACSSSSTPKGEDFAGSCNLLASRCHPVKTALGTECHDLGHVGDDTKCGPRKGECLAECPETAEEEDASTSVDSGTDAPSDGALEADSDAGATVCQAYCTCMAATCASEPNYPFADEAACLAACAGFTAEDRACFADHCEDAKMAADKEHDCEHANGTVACH